MIPINELRIGSWVNDAGMNAMQITEPDQLKRWKSYYPITINEDILKKLSIEAYHMRVLDNYKFKTVRVKRKITSVHELQNRYFDFYEKELEIKF